MVLTQEEQQYKKTVNRLSVAMLVFSGMFLLVSLLVLLLTVITDGMPPVAGDITYQIVYGFLYAAIFVTPVIVFGLIVPKEQRVPMMTEWHLPRETPLYILAGIAIIGAAAFINAQLSDLFFSYNSFNEQLMDSSVQVSTNYQLVLMVLTSAVVPGFVEELLFRGLVLNNLLPYGRTTAVVASALLFGLMHQNIGQFFYATAAGLVLGYVYVYTRSIWPCVLMHFCNNFLSVVFGAIGERMPDERGVALMYVIEFTVMALGVISAIVLILRGKDRRHLLLTEGCFEREVEPDPEYAPIQLPWKRRVRLFFTPGMLVFIAICVAEMLAMLGLAILMQLLPEWLPI